MAFPGPGYKSPRKIEEMKEISKMKIEIKRLPGLKKGDIVIVRMKEDITAGLAQSLVDKLTKTFPDNKSIVLCNNADLYPLPKKILNDMGWYLRKKSK